MKTSLNRQAAGAVIFAAAVLTGSMAGADNDNVRPNTDPLTVEECSACHMSYPAAFLPAASWSRIMQTLDNHFGEDASLGADAVAQIEAYLTSNAPSGVRGVDMANPPLRITELPWFQHEHGSRLQKKALANPAIGTMSNCAACHKGAERGYFEDD